MPLLNIATWNCNGIYTRPVVKARDWNAITQNVDVVLLQEVSFSAERSQHLELDPLQLFHTIALTPSLPQPTLHTPLLSAALSFLIRP